MPLGKAYGDGFAGIANPTQLSTLYIKGSEFVDGSLRFTIDEETGAAAIEERINGLWQQSSFGAGPGTVWLGHQVGIGGVGHHVVTTAPDGHLHFHAHSEFDDDTGLTTEDAKMVHAYAHVSKLVVQSDDSGEFVGSNLEFVLPAGGHQLIKDAFYKTGSVAADDFVEIEVWLGSDDTGTRVYHHKSPAIDFPADTEVNVSTPGYIEFDHVGDYFLRYSSPGTFSLKTNAAETIPWFAINISFVDEDNLLQTKPWASGSTFTKDQWLVEERKIYTCLETGTQTGTFASNADKWSLLADQDYADFKSLLAQNVQNTGVTSGCVITKASDTTLDISAGTGYIADYSDPVNPLTIPIAFPGITGYTPTNLATDGTFLMGIDSSGNLIEVSVDVLSNQIVRDNLLLGIYIADTSIITFTQDAPFSLGYGGVSTADDFIRDVIGPANVKGNLIGPNVGGNLSIDTTGGLLFIIASNFRNNPALPDEIIVPAGSPISVRVAYRQISDRQLNLGAPSLFLDPDQWDDGSGTLQAIPNNKFTVQVIHVGPSGQHYAAYGQQIFNKLSDAELALLNGTLLFEEFPFQERIVQRSFIVIKQGTTDLTDIATAKFFNAGKFRAGGVSTSAGIPGITLPGGANTNVQYNDNGVFGGSNDFTWDEINKQLGINKIPEAGFAVDIAGNLRADQVTVLTPQGYEDATIAGFPRILTSAANDVVIDNSGDVVIREFG